MTMHSLRRVATPAIPLSAQRARGPLASSSHGVRNKTAPPAHCPLAHPTRRFVHVLRRIPRHGYTNSVSHIAFVFLADCTPSPERGLYAYSSACRPSGLKACPPEE